MPTLFSIDDFAVRRLTRTAAPSLQALFDASAADFTFIDGQPLSPDAAHQYFDEFPPPHIRFTELVHAGVFDSQDELKGHLLVVSDLFARSVWQIGAFLLEERLRGTGVAPRIHTALEEWAKANGARWIRVAVTAGHARAERFLAKCGYKQVRLKTRLNAAGRAIETRILIKALAAGSDSEYLALVPFDDPASIVTTPGAA